MLSSHAPVGPSPGRQVANPALLHRFLGIGMVIATVALVILRQTLMAGDSGDGGLFIPAYALAGVSFLMCAASLIVLKPLVPRRNPGQTAAAYWADPTVASKAMLVWFILEGAAILAAVSFFLGGGVIAATLIALAVVLFWTNGPRVFTGE